MICSTTYREDKKMDLFLVKIFESLLSIGLENMTVATNATVFLVIIFCYAKFRK